MKILVAWNILVTAALLFFLTRGSDEEAPTSALKRISSSVDGSEISHGAGAGSGSGFVSSKVGDHGAITRVSHFSKGADPESGEPFGVTQHVGEDFASIWVAFNDSNGYNRSEGGIYATSPESDNVRSGAYLQLSSEGGVNWIELGFTKDGRPFLKASSSREGTKKIWWLLEENDGQIDSSSEVGADQPTTALETKAE